MMITLSAVHQVETKVAMIMSMDTTSKEPRITKRKIHNLAADPHTLSQFLLFMSLLIINCYYKNGRLFSLSFAPQKTFE